MTLNNEWYPRWYYQLRNKTSGKMYLGQRVRDDIGVKYFGSGLYWVNHCKKYGGRNKDNIEVVEKIFFLDEESVISYLKDFEDKEGEYWLEENTKWCNQVPENTMNNPFYETRGRIEKMKNTKNTKEWKDTVGVRTSRLIVENRDNEESGRKQSKTKQSQEWKDTTGNLSKIKISETKQSQEWKDTVGKQRIKRHKETISSEEWKSTTGKERTIKRLEKMDYVVTGKKQSETKSDPVWKQKNQMTCEHCGIVCSKTNHTRFHGNKCRQLNTI